MQLNGTNGPTMAASEPPEPPPRNPDKINASFKQSNEMKANSTEIVNNKNTNNCSINNNCKNNNNSNNNSISFKSILSIENSANAIISKVQSIISPTTQTTSMNDGGGGSGSSRNSAGGIPIVCGEENKNDINNVETNDKLDDDKKNGIVNTNIINNNNNNSNNNNNNNNDNDLKNNPCNNNNHNNNNNNINNKINNDNQDNVDGMGVTEMASLMHHHHQINKENVISLNCNSIKEKDNNIVMDKNNQNTEDKNQNDVKNNNNNNNNNKTIHNNNNSIITNNNNNKNFNLIKKQIGQQTIDDPQSIRLRTENERLIIEITRLKKLLENSPDGAVGGIDLTSDNNNSFDATSTDDSTSRADRLESELKAAKEQISNLKAERKKLKSDKIDLLAHVKQLCSSLQDKEQELRDFIRNFEHRIRETETNNAKITTDRDRERWSLLKHAREESERSLVLAAQLNTRDIQLQRTHEQLVEARRQLSGCMSDQESLLSFPAITPTSGLIIHNNNSNNMTGASGSSSGFGSNLTGVGSSSNCGGVGSLNMTTGSCSADSGVRGSSDKESTAGDLNLSDGTCDNGPCITIDPDSISLVSSHHMYQFGTPKERSPTISPLNLGAFSRSIDSGVLSRSVEQLGSPVDSEGPPVLRRLQSKVSNATGTLGNRSSVSGRGGGGGGSTWGSISRVFARTRHRNKNNSCDNSDSVDFQWSPLTEEGYAEKLRLLREASAIPIDRWRASQVLAWLEVALGMPQYSSRCSENVKSGKVLLELNDGELETGLGLTHPMHRKKLRLAIEEQRRPELIRYLTIGQLGHTWVASEWLPDIGLQQYSESFLHSLVDARMLDTLSKKELEKFLNVTRKFHQASIVHGIHVLRILKYDRESLAMRRAQCESVDADPIVWTNQRFIRWARSIDLAEYSENLKDSGVHGGLVVLEPSFSGDTMATALGIPPSKNIIRRHLAAEFEALILPARATLGQGIRTEGGSVVPITGPGGLQNHLNYHQQYNNTMNDRRSSGSLRGSLSKAFRFSNNKIRLSEKSYTTGNNSISPTPSFSSSSENGIYSTIGSQPAVFGFPVATSNSINQSQSHSQQHHTSNSNNNINGNNNNNNNNYCLYQKHQQQLILHQQKIQPQQIYHQQSMSSLPTTTLSSMIGTPPSSHRISAPPLDTNNSTLPRYSEHRRVKSISDIEIVTVTPAIQSN